jgi:putative addiction module component (TIGR02574 family)
MAASIEEITKEVVGLPRHQRLALVRLLPDLDRPGASEEIDSAWDAEICARVKAVDEGRAVGIPYERIKKEMAEKTTKSPDCDPAAIDG